MDLEAVIRDLNQGTGLAHLPSGRSASNAASLALPTMAHNLAHWVLETGLRCQLPVLTTTFRLRPYLFSFPGRRTRFARRKTLHLSQRSLWQGLFLTALRKIRATT